MEPSLPRANAESRRYRRHEPETTALYSLVEQHGCTLQRHLETHTTSLPAFVLKEFEDYLRCGRLEHGFPRVKCRACLFEHLVAFSCKRRGFCRGRPVRPVARAAGSRPRPIWSIMSCRTFPADSGF